VNKSQNRAVLDGTIMQANAKFTVTDNRIFVRPHFANSKFVKSEQFVEAKRIDDIGCMNSEFQKAP
jgi:hypothetical protein